MALSLQSLINGELRSIFRGKINSNFSAVASAVDGNTGRLDDLEAGPPDSYGQLAGMRNRIINGNMMIAQQGGSFTAPASSSYTLDQWFVGKVGSAVFNVLQSTLPFLGAKYQHYTQVTTAQASLAAGDVIWHGQHLEGYNVADLIGKPINLSFIVQSPKTGKHCIALGNSGADRSYVASYNVDAANTPQKVSIPIPQGLIEAGTWNWTTGRGVIVNFVLAAGTNWHTATENAWVTGGKYGAAGMVNVLDTVGNVFAFSEVQLEPGNVDTPFERRPFSFELSLVYRYYEPLDVVFGNAPSTQYQTHSWTVPKRVPPNITTTLLTGTGVPTFSVTASGGRSVYQATAPTGLGSATVWGSARL